MTILVAVPYFGTPDLIDRCVRSILDQTVRDLAVVVIGDGEHPPLSLSDERLTVTSLRENHGPYYVQQVALEANPHDLYAPVGSDDWLEPDHFERLLAARPPVVTGAVWFHDLAGRVSVHQANYEVGLFPTALLRSLGGFNPQERIGQDSLLIRLLRITGNLRATTHPTYHRVKRPGSLMTSPHTGRGTPARNDMRRRNRLVAVECERLGTIDAIRRYRESLVPTWLADEVADHAFEMSQQLRMAVAA